MFNDGFCINNDAWLRAVDPDVSVKPLDIYLGEVFSHSLEHTFIDGWYDQCADLQHFWADQTKYLI